MTWWIGQDCKCACGAEADPHWGECYECWSRNYQHDGGLREAQAQSFKRQADRLRNRRIARDALAREGAE